MTEAPHTEHEPERAPVAPDEPPFGEALRARNMGWTIRVTGLSVLAATVLGVVVAPGLRGYASDAAVVGWDTAATVMTYAAAILACGAALTGATELALARRAESASGALVVSGSSLVVVLLGVAAIHARRMPDSPPPWQLSMGIALVASSVSSTAAWRAMTGPHARALSIAISAFAMAALLRAAAWQLARAAGDRTGALDEALSRVLVTVAVLVEAMGQAVSAAWIGSRGRAGLVLSSLAAIGAFVATWGAAIGGRPEAPWWASALHGVMGDSNLPPPFALSAAQSFLAASSLFLAAAAILEPRQPAVLTTAFALAILSRGQFDAPIRAIAIVAAGVWAFCAAVDQKILWASLAASRDRAGAPASP